jgi:hypothetical protein
MGESSGLFSGGAANRHRHMITIHHYIYGLFFSILRRVGAVGVAQLKRMSLFLLN